MKQMAAAAMWKGVIARLTVKICYLNRVACWRGVVCPLLCVDTRESGSARDAGKKIEGVRLFNSRGEDSRHDTLFPPREVHMILNSLNLNGGGNQTGTVSESIYAKLGLKFLFHGVRGVEKVMLVYGQKGIGLPLIHSLPHHLLSLLPEILRLSLPLFFMF